MYQSNRACVTSRVPALRIFFLTFVALFFCITAPRARAEDQGQAYLDCLGTAAYTGFKITEPCHDIGGSPEGWIYFGYTDNGTPHQWGFNYFGTCSVRSDITRDQELGTEPVCDTGCAYTAASTTAGLTTFEPSGAICAANPPPPPPPPADPNLGCGCDDGGSAPAAPPPFYGDPINTASGNENLREPDFVGAGLLQFVRYYNSSAAAPSHLLGPHWTNTFGRGIETPDGSTVVVRRADGASFAFTLSSGLWVAPPGIFTKLTRLTDGSGNLTGWTYAQQDAREIENYDSIGRLISIVRNNGDKVSLAYNSPDDYLVTSVTDQAGRSLSFTYTNRQLTQILDPTGGAIQYGYNSFGRLASVTYPGGKSRSYKYGEVDHTSGAFLPDALTGIIDEKNQRYATITYLADGRATSSELAGGVDKHVVTYNADGSSSITLPTSGVIQESLNKATSIFRVSGTTQVANGQTRTESYTFTAGGKVDIITDSAGTTTDYDYNSRGLETQVIESANVPATKRTTQTDWDAAFNVPSEIRVLGPSGVLEAKSTYTYNARGQVLTSSVVNLMNGALTKTRTFTYCEQSGVDAQTCPRVGLLLYVNNPRNDVQDVTKFTYRQNDEASCATPGAGCKYRKGDLWQVTNALSQVTETVSYDGAARPISIKDRNGVVTDLEYNGRGWLTARKVRGIDSASETDDAITLFEYDDAGAVTKIIEPDAAYVGFSYDTAHRLTDATDALGNAIHFSLNLAGQRVHEDTKNAASVVKRSLSRIFDSLGQLQTYADANSTPIDFTYDVTGSLDKTTNPLLKVTDNDVDALGRLKQVIANTGGSTSEKATTQFSYDARDNLLGVVDPKGLATSYVYDSTNNLTQLSSPDTGTSIYGYDSAGDQISRMKADNVTEGFSYDALGRLTAHTFAHSAQNMTYTYDVAQSDCLAGETYTVGHLTKESYQTGISGNTRYCYDIFGNRIRQVQTLNGTTLTVANTYNSAGRLKAMTYPSGAIVTYLRDASGRITRVDAKPMLQGAQVTLVSSISYLPFGPLNTLTFGNGRVLTKAYDNNYQIDSVSDSASTNPLFLDLTVNTVGSVTGLTERTNALSTVARTYLYDGLDRLTTQKNGSVTVEGFGYDATGDRQSKTTGATTSYGYGAGSHRLTTIGGLTRSYNATGETTAFGDGRAFTYNDDHRSTNFSVSGSQKFSNIYNGHGERVGKLVQVGGGGAQNSRIYVYSEEGRLLGEYSAAGARVKEYVWVDDTLVGVMGSFDSTNYQYVETDHLGTPRAVIQPVKNLMVWRWDMNSTAFGEHAPNVNPDGDSLTYELNLRFPGQYYDTESGLIYNYFRDYDPATGRYIESDPLGISGGVSTFSYTGSNPLIRVDTSGLKAVAIKPGSTSNEGRTICKNGVAESILYDFDDHGCDDIVIAARRHEESHVTEANECQVCKGKPDGYWVAYDNREESKQTERKGYGIELSILTRALSRAATETCKRVIRARIADIKGRILPSVEDGTYWSN
jgi:RHS repeat-associated protein